MIYSWKTLTWKTAACFFFAFMLLGACQQLLPQIPPDLQASNQTKNNVALLRKSHPLPNKPQLPRQQLIIYNDSTEDIPPISVTQALIQSKEPPVEVGGMSTVFTETPRLSGNIPIYQADQIIGQTPDLGGNHEITVNPNQNNPGDTFAAPHPPRFRSNVPRVALLLPLSGPHSKLGHAFLNAAELALFHFADKEFELIPQDTMGTPEGAADAAALAISDGASLILGPLFSSSVTAIASAVQTAGISVISFSNDRDVASADVFIMGFLPSEQVERVIHFAHKKGLNRFALLAPNNRYGMAVSKSLDVVAKQLGVEITNNAFYDPDANDFRPVVQDLANYQQRRQNLLDERKKLANRNDAFAQDALKKLENLQTLGDLPFDALMVADGGKRLQAIAALLPYYDIDPKKTRLLGTGLWDSKTLTSEPALVGGWFAAPPNKERQSFIKNYQEMFGSLPPRLATLAYAATALAAIFVKPDGRFDPSEILAPEGFGGRDGIFRFSSQGHTNRGLSIYQVEEKGVKVIEKAPTSFKNPTN